MSLSLSGRWLLKSLSYVVDAMATATLTGTTQLWPTVNCAKEKGLSIVTDITAKVIADSYNDYNGSRITTLQLRYPRFIHSEFMTHRMFSRNASSSRAIPVAKEVGSVINSPALPLHIGANRPGMQANEELDECCKEDVLYELNKLGKRVALAIEYLAEEYGVHKQVLNRYLEPWLHIDTVVTATEWDNFFDLRISEHAQPEICALAVSMRDAIEESTPKEVNWHLPYYDLNVEDLYFDEVVKACAARCARVSYRNHDGTLDVEKDLTLAKQLWENKHLSPFEHVAKAAGDKWYANFYGWQSLRYQSE